MASDNIIVIPKDAIIDGKINHDCSIVIDGEVNGHIK